MIKLIDSLYESRKLLVKGQFIEFRDHEAVVEDDIAREVAANYHIGGIRLVADPNTLEDRKINKKRNINWHSVSDYANGYGHSSAQMLLALSRRKDIHVNFMRAESIGNNNPLNDGNTELKDLENEGWDLYAPTISYMLPQEKNSTLGKQIAFTMFEVSKIPRHWVDVLNTKDLVLVPCNQNVEAFRDSGVTAPIEVVPLGIDPEEYPFYDRSQNDTDIFIFGHFGSLSIRKGTDIAIRAFQKAFPKEEYPNVMFQIKCTPTEVKSWKFYSQDIQKYEEDDRIYEIFERWDQKELYTNLCQWDAFVFPSRGEGFGLPPIEAMASGCPTIITNWSGLADYCNTKYNWSIDNFTMVPNLYKDPALITDGLWAEPDLDSVVKAMRDIYENRKKAFVKAKKGSEWVHKNWTYDHSAQRIVEIIDKYDLW